MSRNIGLARWASCLQLVAILTLAPGCSGSPRKRGGQAQPTAPILSTQPQSQSVLEGAPVTLTVAATATSGTLSYQWKKGTATLTGKTLASLTLDPVTLADAGSYAVVVSSSLNGTTVSTTSNAAVLTVSPAPSTPAFTTQPTGQSVLEGGLATFSVVATGNGTLSYQWKQGALVLAGQTSANLTLNPVTLANAGSYTVVVTNSLNGAMASATSNTAVLTVNPVAATPVINTQPQAQTVLEGSTATLSVAATGNGNLSYQWKKGATVLAGKTSASLVLNPISLADAGSYSVTVTNALNGTTASATSNAAHLTVNPAPATPVITAQPQAQTVLEGGSATLSVTASASNGTLSYQWMKGSTVQAGRTSASLTLTPVALADAGSYTVIVTNSLSGATVATTSDGALLTVNAAPGTPSITSQPVAQTVQVGNSVTLSVVASASNGTLSYQWRKDGVDLVGQTSNTLVLNPAALADAGIYTVVVTNTLNGTTASVTSQAALLTVNPAAAAPTIQVQPQSKTVTVPDGATFSVTASGGELSYEWRKNGTKIDGATGTSYTLAATDLRETSAQYSVVVTNADGSTTSENATLTVMAPSPTYAGDPVTVPSRSLEVKPSYTFNSAAPNGVFRFGFDSDLRNPVWTSYANFRFLAPFVIDSARDYQADDRLTRPVQEGDFYFATTGMSRGHQVMRSDLGYRYGNQASDDSNRMSNMAPQLEAHNGQIWADLEKAVGGENPTAWTPGLADAFGRIWIYTGPVFSEAPSRIPASDVAIPSAFYKVIVRETSPGVPQAMAVLVPHQPVPPKADLWKYVTSVARVEALAKLDLFPTLPETTPANFKTNVDVLGWGAPFEQSAKPNVHMIEPSWDTTVSVGTTVAFTGAASSATGTVSSPTWTFGSEGTANGLTTTHTFNTPGTVSVSFSAADGSAVTHTITRVITVTGGNAAPTISAIGNQTTAQDTLKSLTFTVSDDTTAAGSLLVTATSNNQTLLPDASVQVSNTTGTCTLTMTPAAGQTGTAQVTITAQDGDNATTTQTFDLTVSVGGGGSGQPTLIISEYYEGSSTNKWIEITNVGDGTYDAGVSPMYLGQWNNPRTSTSTIYRVMLVPGTLAPGASKLFRHTTVALPAYASSFGDVVVDPNSAASNGVISFNGNDVIYLTPLNDATVAGFNARTDVIGDVATWDPATGTQMGANTAWVRKAPIKTPNATFTVGDWTQFTNALVDAALSGTTERLGEHVYNP